MESNRPSIRCLLGHHDYRYIGEQERTFRGDRRFGYEGWNMECARCHKTGWWVSAKKELRHGF